MYFTFSDMLTEADVKRNIIHHFETPDVGERLTIRLAFEPLSFDGIHNMLTLTLFDPEGFRGAGHRGGNEHEVVIAYNSASPGYRAGWLPPGKWTVQIDTHMILPGESCHYKLTVHAEMRRVVPEPDVREVYEPPRFDTVANPNSGWYRGDLHSHTVHSDADWSVFDLYTAALAQGLDFIALTDHNTVSGLAEMERDAGLRALLAMDDQFGMEQLSEFGGLLPLGGQELTTFWGHAVCLGAHEWIDWRTTQNGDEMTTIAQRLYADGQIFIIAHPKDVGDPYCTGCRWLYPKLMPGLARFLEVWNGPWQSGHGQVDTKNREGLALWYEWLNAGHRLVATAGSDAHGPEDYAKKPAFNVIYAEELSRQGIFDGLRMGHLYLSSGPNLGFAAWEEDGEGGKMGDTILVSSPSTAITLGSLWFKAPPGARIRLMADGEELESRSIDEEGTLEWSISIQELNWCLLEMRDASGDMLALTNPIFFEIVEEKNR